MEDDSAAALSELGAHNVRPLWTASVNAVTRVPPGVPLRRAVPTAWRYQTIRAELIRAGATVSVEEAERRVLVLVNPGHRTLRARRRFVGLSWASTGASGRSNISSQTLSGGVPLHH
jgi:Gentisate 1,2-dioxygenase